MKYKCPCCQSEVFEESGKYEICPVCSWEDDPIQAKDEDFEGGANKLSLKQAREEYAKKSQLEEYVVFSIITSEGKEVELAVVDEFEVDHKIYVAASIVEEDIINEDGVYIYKVKATEPELEVEKITDMKEYEKVILAYENMEE